jgi:hypothetical protein
MKFKSRAATKWADIDASQVPSHDNLGSRENDGTTFAPEVLFESAQQCLELQAEADATEGGNSYTLAEKRNAFMTELTADYKKRFEHSNNKQSLKTNTLNHFLNDWNKYGSKWASKMTLKLALDTQKKEQDGSELLDGEMNLKSSGAFGDVKVELPSPPHSLNEDQQEVFRIVTKTVLGSKDQCLVFVHGPPGTGKTFLSAEVESALLQNGIRSYGCSFAWSTTLEMKLRGRTTSIHHLIGCDLSLSVAFVVSDKFPTAKMVRRAKERLKGIDVLFIDEISTVSPLLIVALNKVIGAARQELGKARTRHQHTGGLNVIITGDFAQLKNPGSESLASILVDFSLEEKKGIHLKPAEIVNTAAAKWLVPFKRIILNKQERAGGDVEHCELLEKFDLSNDNPPLTKRDLANMQRWTPALIRKDPAFLDAVIAVQTNFERINLNFLRQQEFAIRKGKAIFRWIMPMTSTSGNSAVLTAQLANNCGAKE